jgi:hypothetical protein
LKFICITGAPRNQGHVQDRLDDVDVLQAQARFAGKMSVSGDALLETGSQNDFPGPGFGDGFMAIGVNRVELVNLFKSLQPRVVHGAVFLDAAVIDSNEYLLVRALEEDLEDKTHELLRLHVLSFHLLQNMGVRMRLRGEGRKWTMPSMMGCTPMFLRALPQ